MSQTHGALTSDRSNLRKRIISSKDSTQSSIKPTDENTTSLLRVIMHGKETYVDITGIKSVTQLMVVAAQNISRSKRPEPSSDR